MSFDAKIERFMERPASHKAMVWLFSLGFVGFIAWQYILGAVINERTKLSEKIENLETEEMSQRRLSRDLPKMREAVKALDIQLQAILQELPDKRAIPELLSAISDLAKDAGLDVKLFKPKPEILKEFYAEIPVQLIVEGNYHQVGSFFDEIGKLDRIVNVSEISMKEPKLQPGIQKVPVTTNCIATTFRYLEESERIKPAEQDSKQRRKK